MNTVVLDRHYALLGKKPDEVSPELRRYIEVTAIACKEDMTYDQMIEHYIEEAKDYDEDEHLFGNDIAVLATTLTEKYTAGNKDARVLDVCAGTGLIGKQLHIAGYRDLDAVDASEAMLEEARKKNVYKNIIVSYLGGDNQLDVPDNTYDHIIMTGCLCDGHVKPSCFGCFRDLVRIIKPGGHFVGTIYEPCVTAKYRAALEAAFNMLVDEGLWSWVENTVVENPNHPLGNHKEAVWVLRVN